MTFTVHPGIRGLCGSGIALAAALSITLSTHSLAGEMVPNTGAAARPLEEVVVEGHRGLRELRTQMIVLEDRFYARFNDLNIDDRFDIHCDETARTGTRLERRTCSVAYESSAREDEGQRHHAALLYSMPNGVSSSPIPMQGGENTGGKEWIAPIPAIVAIEMRRKQFKATMVEVTRNDAELMELLRQRLELADKHEQMRRQVSNRDSAPARPR